MDFFFDNNKYLSITIILGTFLHITIYLIWIFVINKPARKPVSSE